MIGLNDIGEQLFGQKRHSYKLQNQPPLDPPRTEVVNRLRFSREQPLCRWPHTLYVRSWTLVSLQFFRPKSLLRSVLSLSVPKFSCVIGPGRRRWYCPSNTVFEVLDIYSKGRGKNFVNQRRGDGKRNPKNLPRTF